MSYSIYQTVRHSWLGGASQAYKINRDEVWNLEFVESSNDYKTIMNRMIILTKEKDHECNKWNYTDEQVLSYINNPEKVHLRMFNLVSNDKGTTELLNDIKKALIDNKIDII